MMQYGLSTEDLNGLKRVFARHQGIEKVIMYGSRAKGNYKPFSDIDLTMVGDQITHRDLVEVIDEIDDLLLPYGVDISIFSNLKNEELIDHINRRGVVIYLLGE